MLRPAHVLAAVACLAAACSKAPPSSASLPTPAPKIVYVVVTATPATKAEPDYRATVAYAVPVIPTAVAVPAVADVPAAPKEKPYCVIQDFLVRPPDSIGSIWFDGEVRNLGSQPARVKVLVKAYSINEVLLDSKSFYPDRHPVPPGESAHFNNYVGSKTGQIAKVIPEVIPD